MPFLIGGHGKRVVGIAGRHADIFQFTGLTHGAGGVPEPGGFDLDAVGQRRDWLEESAGDRLDSIERSVLVQATAVGDGAGAGIDAIVDATGLDRATVEATPFVLMGSVEQLVDKVERLRDEFGITHFVVREPTDFAPVAARLGGRPATDE